MEKNNKATPIKDAPAISTIEQQVDKYIAQSTSGGVNGGFVVQFDSVFFDITTLDINVVYLLISLEKRGELDRNKLKELVNAVEPDRDGRVIKGTYKDPFGVVRDIRDLDITGMALRANSPVPDPFDTMLDNVTINHRDMHDTADIPKMLMSGVSGEPHSAMTRRMVDHALVRPAIIGMMREKMDNDRMLVMLQREMDSTRPMDPGSFVYRNYQNMRGGFADHFGDSMIFQTMRTGGLSKSEKKRRKKFYSAELAKLQNKAKANPLLQFLIKKI